MQPNEPMQPPAGTAAAALNGFLQDYLADLEGGSPRSLEEYQARHPWAASLIAAELGRLQPSTGGSAAEDGDREPGPVGAGRIDAVGSRIGPYELERELGRGGQGAVFLARDTRLGRRVALKLLLSHASWSRVHLERFHREAALAARLDHPGLCTVFESNSANGVPYVVLRYVEGETLAERLRRGPLAPREAARIVERAARALAIAHEAGIVHRDVKPANLMLTPEDELVVLDFGLAREVDSSGDTLTRTGDVFGTPAYMAPEQIDPEIGPCDPRTDVWALGVTLAETLAGQPPFRAPTRAGLNRVILGGTLELAPQLPRDLAVVLRTALAPEPSRRYATALDLADDLWAWREGRPIAARPVRALERLWRWAARNRRLAAALGLAAGLLVLGSTGTTVGWLRTRARERELALSKLEAEETASRALALNAYLARMLESPNPLRGLGTARRDVTLGEMLDHASETLATAFPGRPDLEAETRVSIGTTYSGLGRYEDARSHYAAALALYRGLHGEHHADVARVRRLHATALGLLGDLNAAIPELEASLALSRAIHGEQHPEIAQAHTDLGWALLEAGRFSEAQAHSKAAVEWFRGSGEHPYELASATNNLAMSLRALGDSAGAEAAYQSAIDAFQALFGGDSALAGAATGNLAFLLAKEGREDEALASYAQATTTLRGTLGEHPLLGSTLLGYATALYAHGDLTEAEAACAEASAVLLTTLGESNDEYSIAVELRGLVCTDLGRHADAEGYYRASAQLLRAYHNDPDRALIDDAWAAEAQVMGGDGAAGLDALEGLWNEALKGREPRDAVPQAVARTGVRACKQVGDPARSALWAARLEP